ncbi:MAG: 2-oxo acid dehydrogenase subunit E2 [Micromonosporaceae bacterium]
MAEFRMPSLGADMESGVLVEWLVAPGDMVHKGDIVAVVDTAKAAVEVECFTGGVIEQLLVRPGTRVPVGAVLATIAAEVGGPGERAVAATPAPVRSLSNPPAASAGRSPVTSPLIRRLAAERHVDLVAVHGTGVGGRVTHADVAAARPMAENPPVGARNGARVMASPLARRIAAELGVDLATVAGTGRGGVVDAADVRAAATPAPPAAQPLVAQPGDAAARADAMRAAIAALMARSKREIPHYYLTETVDLGMAMDWLHERNRALSVTQRLVPAALLLKAAARAAATVTELNGFWIDDKFVAGPAVHLGVAISLRGGGLVAPAIHHADQRDLADLMAALRDLVARTRAGRLRGAEMSDPTITVSNLGDQGVESILGVIYPPQVALVGFGRVVERAWAVRGLIGVRPTVTVTLAGDHRATDGATGARYLNTVGQLLQRPEEL